MIRAEGLTRVFGERTAVDNVSFTVETGRICVLLGPNGAGKTTTFRMLCGLIRPTSGRAAVAGIDLPGTLETRAGLRARIGLLTETPGLYDRLSAVENLTLFGRLYGIPEGTLAARIEGHLRAFDLLDRRHDPVATWSKGMRQKLAIVRTIFHEPDVLFFDEPTAGLDPESSKTVRSLIASLKREGRTIVVLTHNLGEATELADVVGVIRGRLLAFGNPGSLTRGDSLPRCRISVIGDLAAAGSLVRAVAGVVQVDAEGGHLHVQMREATFIAAAIASLTQAGYGVMDARSVERSLEDVYLDAIAGAA